MTITVGGQTSHERAANQPLPAQAATVAERFAHRFARPARVFQAPGRINIIGEHTDYCGGLVMPAAIEHRCLVAAARNGSDQLNAASASFGAEASGRLDTLTPGGHWFDYVAGVADTLIKAGIAVPGCDIWIESSVPIGTGVSSSAALEVSVVHALLVLAGETADGVQIAKWAQQAENEFVGMPCGLMDQYASANGVEGAALMLDCSTLECSPIPLPSDLSFLLVDSTVRHSHVEGAYRARREDCEIAARTLGVRLLAELDEDDLDTALMRLPANPAKRCRHVVSECGRVRRAAAALRRGDAAELGRLMNQSHASLRDDMEVSVPQADRLAEIAQTTAGVLGARMMGGGFGGYVIALVEKDAAQSAKAAIVARFGDVVGRRPAIVLCRSASGAGEIHW